MTHRVRRTVVAAAVVPLVVLVGLQSAWAAYACIGDGQVREACCCPAKPDRDPPPDDGPHIEARCCDVTLHVSSRAPDARETEPSRADRPVVVVVAVAARVVVPASTVPASGRIGFARPPPPAVPTYIVNRAILR